MGKFAGTNRERNRLGDDEETNTFKVLRRREDLGGRFFGWTCVRKWTDARWSTGPTPVIRSCIFDIVWRFGLILSDPRWG